jgi:hypothetical protein
VIAGLRTHVVAAGIAMLFLVGCAAQSATVSTSPISSASPITGTAPSDPAAPSVAASAEPTTSTSSTPAPTPAGSNPGRFSVDLILSTGRTVKMEVKDDSGMLIKAASGIPGDGASVAENTVNVVNGAPEVLQLTWSGPPCATDGFVLIDDRAARITVVQPVCSGDAIALDRVLMLTFSGPVGASSVSVIFQAGTDTVG